MTDGAIGGYGSQVRSATVSRVVRIDDAHALVTVAASLDGPEPTRLLTVPIERDTHGGLVVDELPSFAPRPARAEATADDLEPLIGAERAEISNVVTAFLRAYLAGDASALDYLVPPGTHPGAAAGNWQLVNLSSLSQLGLAGKTSRTVLVRVLARDDRSRAMYALSYRVRLVRRDRWYVADLDGPGRATR